MFGNTPLPTVKLDTGEPGMQVPLVVVAATSTGYEKAGSPDTVVG